MPFVQCCDERGSIELKNVFAVIHHCLSGNDGIQACVDAILHTVFLMRMRYFLSDKDRHGNRCVTWSMRIELPNGELKQVGRALRLLPIRMLVLERRSYRSHDIRNYEMAQNFRRQSYCSGEHIAIVNNWRKIVQKSRAVVRNY